MVATIGLGILTVTGQASDQDGWNGWPTESTELSVSSVDPIKQAPELKIGHETGEVSTKRPASAGKQHRSGSKTDPSKPSGQHMSEVVLSAIDQENKTLSTTSIAHNVTPNATGAASQHAKPLIPPPPNLPLSQQVGSNNAGTGKESSDDESVNASGESSNDDPLNQTNMDDVD
jgi:hypothetical protein